MMGDPSGQAECVSHGSHQFIQSFNKVFQALVLFFGWVEDNLSILLADHQTAPGIMRVILAPIGCTDSHNGDQTVFRSDVNVL